MSAIIVINTTWQIENVANLFEGLIKGIPLQFLIKTNKMYLTHSRARGRGRLIFTMKLNQKLKTTKVILFEFSTKMHRYFKVINLILITYYVNVINRFKD